MKSKPATRLHTLAAAAVLALSAHSAHAVAYNWNSGTFSAGVTAPSPLPAADVLNIGAGGNKFFDGSVSGFTNAGTVNWNSDILYVMSGAAVVNNNLWVAGSDHSINYNGGTAPSFTNNGTFRKSGGSGSTTINGNVGFVNNGTLDAQTGTINFNGGSSFNAGSVFSGAGTVNASAGTNSFSGAFTSSNLLLSGGTHQGVSAAIGGTVRLGGGTLGGTWGVGAGQALNAEAGGNKFIDGGATIVTNNGTLAWNTTDLLYLMNGATLRNQALFVANASTSVAYNGGPGPAFTNSSAGTVRAAAGVTLNINNVTGFVNNGGTLDAAAGAAIRYNSGSTFNAGTSFTGAGSNVAAGNNSFAGSFTSANLVLESGNHSGSSAVINGSASYTGGYLMGTWSVAAGQTLNAASGLNKFIDGGTTVLGNLGTVNWNTTDTLYLQSGATVSNAGLFVASQSAQVAYNGGTGPQFVNASTGTVRAAAGAALNFGVGSGLVNNGGVLNALTGGSITYAGGSTFNSGTQFTGAGSNVAAGSNTFNGAITSANLVLQGGNHTGGAAVVNGVLAFVGGTLTGGWTVAGGQTLSAQGGANKFIDGGSTVLTNQGTVNWNSTDTLYLQSGATVHNPGLFLASDSMTVAYNGGTGPVFNNTGTVRVAAGKTLTINGGTGFVNNAGVLDALAGASIVFANGSTFNSGSQFTGAGSNVATGNNSFNGNLSSTNLVLQSGVHNGGAASVNGSVNWTGGTLTGSWTVAAGQTLISGTGAANKFIDGASVTNKGTLAWNATDTLYLVNGASLANQGTLNFSTDSSVAYNGGAGPSFVNTGLIAKTGGAATTGIGDNLGFNNLGTIDVQTGSFALPTNFTNNGTLKGLGRYAVSGTLTNAGTLAPGASPGTLSLTGNYAQTAAGTFAVELQSSTVADRFNITGTAALGGTLAISCWAACSMAVGDVVTILDSDGALSGSFASVALSGFATGAFNVVYDTLNTRVQLVVTQAVTAVPEPGTYALLLAGLGAVGWLVRRRSA